MATHARKARPKRPTATTVVATDRVRCDGPCGVKHQVEYMELAWLGAYCLECLPRVLTEWHEMRTRAVRGHVEDQERWARHASMLAESPRRWTDSARVVRAYLGFA